MSQIWNIDASHTSLDFAVKHMAISTVRGHFRALSGTVTTNPSGALEGFEASIDASSIDTKDAQRDGHLKSPDFFDVANHPTINFKSTNVQAKGGNEYTVTGDLSMHGITKPVTLEVETVPPIKDPWGLTRTAASATGKISRKEWDLTWNQVLELGALLVSDEIKITLEVEAVIPPATPAA
jgi:polyisoprenoid-binding protein YceI